MREAGAERQRENCLNRKEVKHNVKGSAYKNYDELLLFLSAATVAKEIGRAHV